MNGSARQYRYGFAALAPLKIMVAYLVFTFALVVFGPVVYHQFPIGKTALFMFAVTVAMAIGYMHGLNVGLVPSPRESRGDPGLIVRIFDISLGIALLALVLAVLDGLTTGSINTSLAGIGEAYLSEYEGYERNTGNYSTFFILYSLSLPFTFIATVWGFLYFQRLGAMRRALTLVMVVGGLLYYVIGTGKQKQLGDVLIYLFAILLVKYAIRGKPLSFRTIRYLVAGIVAAVMLFVMVLGQRYDVLGIDFANINQRTLDLIYYDTGHPVFTLLGPDFGLGLSIFSSYLSQGYYGLGLALETDWSWTRMTGFSYSVSVIADRLLGMEWQWPNTLVYQVGVTTGWGESKWHTVFAHFATDFTWPGTVLLFGFFAYVYARSWLAAIRHENPFAVLMFALLTLGMFFMPANNQLLHTPGALFTAVVAIGLYLMFARRFNGAPAPQFGARRQGQGAMAFRT